MSMDKFSMAISQQIDRMISESTELFYVEMERDELFTLYLESFPEGTNPLYRERTVHDCQSCKSFIRSAGNMVAIINGQLETVWNINADKFKDCFGAVAKAMNRAVLSKHIAGIYRRKEKTLGRPMNIEEVKINDLIIENVYEHLFYTLPSKFVVAKNIDTARGDARTNKEVLERSLNEISLEAGELVLDLIEQNQLYKGQEVSVHNQVKKFVEVRTEFDTVGEGQGDQYLWAKSAELKAYGRFRNNAMGTLLLDISAGTPLEVAVRKYEAMVAPQNYKRTTALITQKMIDRAEAKIEELGFGDSLERRFATAKDLTINNVLFADKGTKKKMKKGKKKKGALADLEPSKLNINSDKLQKVDIEEFMNSILPHADSIEIMVDNRHVNNLMSIIAPSKRKSPNMFKWHNPFSWSYNGEVTDSIKERVKKAGGNVEAFLRFSLSWHYYDDLDIHIIEPSGHEIYYGYTRSPRSSGFLDVDMNIQPETLEPVENIAWADNNRIQEGRYTVFVENYTKRDMSASGFEVQMEIDGKTSLFVYDKPLRHKERVQVIAFDYTRSKGLTPVKSLSSSTTSKEVWNIETQKWTKVNMVLNSPNHWNGEKVGNKHWFFILEDCLNPDRARGFYNEFLHNDLRDHRKVLEVLSSKMKTEVSDKQLSGVGFSSTQPNRLLCRWVKDNFESTVEITFAPPRIGFKEVSSVPIGLKMCTCEICKRSVYDADNRVSCPYCNDTFHTAHFFEWIRVRSTCPVCRKPVSQHQIDNIAQLITV